MNADAAKQLVNKDEVSPKPKVGLRLPTIGRGQVIGLIAVLGALAWCYAPNLLWLYRIWVREPDYSHGFFVLPIALLILWKRWPRGETEPEGIVTKLARVDSWWVGWLLVVGTLAARFWFNERGMNWVESFTLLPLLVGLALAGLGWRTMSRIWPAFVFLLFLYPLPPKFNSALSQPLQSVATTCACGLLRLTGLWVMPEGNVILVGNERLEVAAACNGLSMLMSLAATIAAMASLVTMSAWKRVTLLMSIIPIALGSNVLRIAATAWCYYSFGAEAGSKYAHDAAGWLMMPTALVLVFMELIIMNWLIVESEESDRTSDRLGLSMMIGAPKSPSFAPVATSKNGESDRNAEPIVVEEESLSPVGSLKMGDES